MKAYVFIIMSICGIGGSEQYTYNKMNYLKNHGYEVYIFSGFNRDILIEGFKDYQKDIIPAVMYAPCFYTKNEVERVLQRMEKRIRFPEFEEYIIESDGIDEAKWGELLAKRLHCKHLLMNVQETHNYTEKEIDFLKFKLKRKELYGITKISVNQMLKDYTTDFSDTRFAACCNNVVFDCKETVSQQLNPNAEYTISSIGRLDKACVFPMLDGICDIFMKYKKTSFNLLLIGGSDSQKTISLIKNKIKKCPNVNLVITGLIYPIPRRLIKLSDVFVSTAGSAIVSYMEQKPTIMVHPVNGLPCGVCGYNYFSGYMYKTLESTNVSELIEKLILKKIIPQYDPNELKNYDNDMIQKFEKQLCYVYGCDSFEYYDIKKIDYDLDTKKHFLYYILGKTFGGDYMQYILEKLRLLCNCIEFNF